MNPRSYNVFGLTTSFGLQLALFKDFGSSWSEREEFAPNFISGGGAGLRLLLPYVGMVRLDLDFGCDDPGVIFHVGTEEKAVRQRRRVR
jgi:outer membrane translocation and assembly module TamA